MLIIYYAKIDLTTVHVEKVDINRRCDHLFPFVMYIQMKQLLEREKKIFVHWDFI